MSDEDHAETVAVILAGGRSQRMGGADKGVLELSGKPLIGRVYEKLKAQADSVFISGRHYYGLGLDVIHDRDDGPKGPAAGLWAAVKFFEEQGLSLDGFATVPVDGPFLPDDLIEKLREPGSSAVASDGARDHPTFAWWRVEDLKPILESTRAPALHKIADLCGAHPVVFPVQNLININTPEDMTAAEQRLTP